MKTVLTVAEIEQAIEFYLNNAVLKEPVNVKGVKINRTEWHSADKIDSLEFDTQPKKVKTEITETGKK